jgi:hypothetical protein
MSDASPFIAHNGFALPAQGLGTYDFRGEAARMPSAAASRAATG